MLKKIPVTAVLVGMYIHGFEGKWMDHPFWRGRFALTNSDYPHGLNAPDINVFARMAAVCDVYDAMTLRASLSVKTLRAMKNICLDLCSWREAYPVLAISSDAAHYPVNVRL